MIIYRSWSIEQERDGSWSIFHNGTGYVRGNFSSSIAAKQYLVSLIG